MSNTTKNTLPVDTDLIFYGSKDDVIPVGTYDYNDFSALPKKEGSHEMVGFDSKYRDFVDYIIRITHEIWEERSIGVIYDTYHNNVTMHLGTINAVGVHGVIKNTLETLFAFPDRRLIGQNVVWSKYGKEGYLSSHRILSTATNLNDSTYGPATGKVVNFRTVVDCAAEHNRIHEEWLVRDNLWIVKQLGLDPHEVAKGMAQASVDNAAVNGTEYGRGENQEGQFFPEKYEAQDDTVGEMLKALYLRIYNGRRFNEVRDFYTDNAVIHYICNKDLNGYQQIQGMMVALFASFPNARFEVERITINDREDGEYDAAIRWRLYGIHEGLGAFGPASGVQVNANGINHVRVTKDNKVAEEWMTYDGLDILRQIYMGKLHQEQQAQEQTGE